MQSTDPHWTVRVVDVLVALTEVGGPEGAAEIKTDFGAEDMKKSNEG